MTAHRQFYPFCPFVLGQNIGNIPLEEETEPHNIPEKEEQSKEEDRETVTNSGVEVDSNDIINKMPWAGDVGDSQMQYQAE